MSAEIEEMDTEHPLDTFRRSLMTAAESAESDDVVDRLQERILKAETVDDVLADSGLLFVDDDDLIGVPLTLLTGHWNRSTLSVDPDVYAVLSCVVAEDATGAEGTAWVKGTEVTIGCGSANVKAQLYRLDQLGKLEGLTVRFRSKQTGSGHTVLRLAKA